MIGEGRRDGDEIVGGMGERNIVWRQYKRYGYGNRLWDTDGEGE